MRHILRLQCEMEDMANICVLKVKEDQMRLDAWMY